MYKMADPKKDRNIDVDSEVLTSETEREVDLDTILVEEIGQFGKYQLKTFLLSVILVLFIAWGAVEYVFTTARISTR